MGLSTAHIAVIAFAFIVLASLMFAATFLSSDILAFWEQVRFEELSGDDARAAIETFNLHPFPQDATDFHYAAQFRNASLAWARFQTPPDALPPIVETAFSTIQLIDGCLPLFEAPPSGADWWTPDAAQTFAGGRDETTLIMIDKTLPDYWLVYLNSIIPAPVIGPDGMAQEPPPVVYGSC